MKQRIVVNGADNFVGRRVLASLARSDWAEPHAVRTGDLSALRTALGGADAVANCIMGRATDILSGAKTLIGGDNSLPPALRIVHLSSMTVYGSAEGRVDESSPTLADLGDYSEAQLAAESAVSAHANTVILRLGAEYGSGCPAWTDRVAHWLRARRLGDMGVCGDGICNLIFIEDLVEIVLQALRPPHGGGQIFNVVQSEKLTWNEYFSRFAIALGAVPVRRISTRRLTLESKIFSVPLKLAQIAAGAARLGKLGIPPPITPSLLQSCRQEIWLSGLKAEKAFGVKWTPLTTGLLDAAGKTPT